MVAKQTYGSLPRAADRRRRRNVTSETSVASMNSVSTSVITSRPRPPPKSTSDNAFNNDTGTKKSARPTETAARRPFMPPVGTSAPGVPGGPLTSTSGTGAAGAAGADDAGAGDAVGAAGS